MNGACYDDVFIYDIALADAKQISLVVSADDGGYVLALASGDAHALLGKLESTPRGDAVYVSGVSGARPRPDMSSSTFHVS